VDWLENAGHVRRERDPHDRRKVTIVMQPPALHLAMEFFVPLGRLMHDNVADIDPPDLQRAAANPRRQRKSHQVNAYADQPKRHVPLQY
jgi:hypothetical protein